MTANWSKQTYGNRLFIGMSGSGLFKEKKATVYVTVRDIGFLGRIGIETTVGNSLRTVQCQVFARAA